MSLRADKQLDASKLVKGVTNNRDLAKEYTNNFKNSNKISGILCADEALAVVVDAKLSRNQYQLIRTKATERFPSYKVVQLAKQKCYPPEGIIVTATSAEIDLQAILCHTSKRLLLANQEALKNLGDTDMCLICKWGFDGSSGHSSYKQAFHGQNASDSSIFISTIVPLRLVCGSKSIWENPRPSSTRFCRPLKMEFVKESTELAISEKNRVDELIKRLNPSSFTSGERTFSIRYELLFTMIDGKICNALTGTTSTQKCYICGASSKMFNNVDQMLTRKITENNLEFGLSVLHGWIRFFESLLYLAYKLPIKKWQARGSDKAIVSENKKRIQEAFR